MAQCTPIDKIQDMHKEWYNKHSAALKKAGISKDDIDAKLMQVWYRKAVTNDDSGVMAHITSASRQDKVQMAFNGSSYKDTKVLQVQEGIGRVTVATTNGTYTFKNGSGTSEPTAKGMMATIPMMANITEMTEYDVLRSDELADLEGEYEKQADLVRNPEKAIELAERLAAIDKVQISEKHKKRLVEILKTLTNPMKEFIPETAIYLNDKANKNGGMMLVGGEREGIYINQQDRAPTRSMQMSATEAYTHEMVHAATYYAIKQSGAKVAGTIQRLNALRERAMKEIVAEDLLPEVSIDREADLAEAQKILDYMNKDLNEFLAIAMTNEKVFNRLSKMEAYQGKKEKYDSLWDMLVDQVKVILDTVFRLGRREEKGLKNDKLLMKLMLELAENNNQALKIEKESLLDQAFDFKDDLDEKASEYLEKLGDLAKAKKLGTMPENLTEVGKYKWALKGAYKFVADPDTREVFELMLSSIGAKPEGWIQTTLRNFRDSDSLQLIVERMGLLSKQIDSRRENTRRNISNAVLEGFSKEPSKTELTALSLAVLDTDLGTVYETYGSDKVKTLLESDEELQKEIAKVEDELSSMASKEYAEVYKHQARTLGRYMATHVAEDPALMYNAEMIGTMAGTKMETLDVTQKTIDKIDELATLQALRYTDKSSKALVGGLIAAEETGVRNLVALQKSFVDRSKQELFAGEKTMHRIKGYNKELFDNDITLKVASVVQKKDMEKEGFTVAKVLEKNKYDRSEPTMAIYVNKHHMTQSYNQTNMRITDLNRKGTSLTAIRAEEMSDSKWSGRKADVNDLKGERDKILNKVVKGTYKAQEGIGLAPVYSQDGTIVDYRYMMSKADKARLLNQDLNAAKVIGGNYASINDKIDSSKHNKDLMEVIRSDMKENYREGTTLGKNYKEYVVISPGSTNKEIQDMYNVLTKEVKEDIALNGPIAVRRDLLYMYFGFRDASIVNTVLGKVMTKHIKALVRQAEMWWKEVVITHKVDIIIRTPKVLIDNVISNYVQGMLAGFNPIEVLRLQMDGWKEISRFQKNVHELIKLEAAKASGNIRKLDLRRIDRLKDEIENSPAKELIDEGLFQAIIEDASIEDLSESGKLTKKKDELLDKIGAPEWVKTGSDILWLTDKTKYFKMMAKATQYSDFVARYAQYHLTVEKEQKRAARKKGKKLTADELAEVKRRAVKAVREAYINYDLPNSKWVQYANDMGLVMFTKYFERIQKVVRNNAKDRPITLMAALLGQAYITGDISDTTDQSLPMKDLSNIFYNPVDHIMGAVVPTFGEFTYEAYKAVR